MHGKAFGYQGLAHCNPGAFAVAVAVAVAVADTFRIRPYKALIKNIRNYLK